MTGITFDMNPVLTPTITTAITIVSVLLCTIAIISVGFRYYTRIWIVKSLGWDDHFALLSTVLLTAYCILVSVGFELCKNKKTADTHFLSNITSIVLAIEVFYIVTVGFFKVSLALFFLRVTIIRSLRRAIIWVVGIISVFGAGYFFFAIFQCGPPQRSTFFIKKLEQQCASYSATIGLAYTHGVLMALTDLLFLLLVYPIISPTTLRPREKFNVALLLGIGAL
jgi:hypothetical protein